MKNTRWRAVLSRFGVILFAVLAIGATQSPAQQYVGIRTVDFNFVAAAQQQSEWCWAASIQMILNYYGIPATQQEIVTRTYADPCRPTGKRCCYKFSTKWLGKNDRRRNPNHSLRDR